MHRLAYLSAALLLAACAQTPSQKLAATCADLEGRAQSVSGEHADLMNGAALHCRIDVARMARREKAVALRNAAIVWGAHHSVYMPPTVVVPDYAALAEK